MSTLSILAIYTVHQIYHTKDLCNIAYLCGLLELCYSPVSRKLKYLQNVNEP